MTAFPPCPNCAGQGSTEAEDHGGTIEYWPCRACGGLGVLITPELREAVGSTIWELVPFNDKEDVADAVLAVVVEKLKEQEKSG